MVFDVGLNKLYKKKQKWRAGKIFGEAQKKLGQQEKNSPPQKTKIKTNPIKILFIKRKITGGGGKKVGGSQKN